MVFEDVDAIIKFGECPRRSRNYAGFNAGSGGGLLSGSAPFARKTFARTCQISNESWDFR